MQGTLIVVVGVGLMYLVVSKKLDCLIAACRVCSSGAGAGAGAVTPANEIKPGTTDPKAVLNSVLSFNS